MNNDSIVGKTSAKFLPVEVVEGSDELIEKDVDLRFALARRILG